MLRLLIIAILVVCSGCQEDYKDDLVDVVTPEVVVWEGTTVIGNYPITVYDGPVLKLYEEVTIIDWHGEERIGIRKMREDGKTYIEVIRPILISQGQGNDPKWIEIIVKYPDPMVVE